MIRKLILILGLATLAGSTAFAQTSSSAETPQPWNALGFAYGFGPNSPPALQVWTGANAAGTYSVTLIFGQISFGQGVTFTPISVNAPVTIGGGASTETVTPSSVSCSTPAVIYTCSFTATFAYAHNNGDLVRSGDFGLEEAATYALSQGGGVVAITAPFFSAAGLTTNAGLTTYIGGYKSVSPKVTLLNWGGISGALSYTAAAGSNYAATTYVLY